MVTIQTRLPASFPPLLRKEAEAAILEEMEWRVEGGTMSTRAEMRSRRDSWSGASESTESSETEEDVREDEGEA